MAKPELGLKRVCVACGTKFYDLTRTPATCPKCGTEQPAEQPRLRRAAGALPAEDKVKKRAAAAAEPELEGDEVEIEDVEADETIEDAEELEDDNEDLEVSDDRDEEA
jgi:uncharacterized protein (TIGR02300 family)